MNEKMKTSSKTAALMPNQMQWNTVPGSSPSMQRFSEASLDDSVGPLTGLPKMLIIGFDAEWVRKEDGNQILSYQYHAAHTQKGAWRGIRYPAKGTRFKLGDFIHDVIHDGRKLKLFSHWPKNVYIVSHFSISDLAAFDDFQSLSMEFDSIRRTFITLKKAYAMTINTEPGNNPHEILVTLRDSLLLAPAGKHALAEVGDLVGLEKIDLPDGMKERMDVLLEENRELFEEYGLRDPAISLKYVLKMLRLNIEINGKFEIPTTLSSMGLTYLLRLWEDHQPKIDKCAVLGITFKKHRVWSEAAKHSFEKPIKELLPEREMHEQFARMCYQGGRNEQYLFGAGEFCDETEQDKPESEKRFWTDYDLSTAYPTAMSVIGIPLWKEVFHPKTPKEFKPDGLGYARVEFKFPEKTRFPCLPVRTDYGIVFPLAGESFCCGPEVFLALEMGAEINLLDGIILPTSSEIRPFEAFVVSCTERRRHYEKGSLENLFWKEMTNGTYGKTAQGVRKKKCFDSRTRATVEMPESRITNPFIAAFVTSFVRATLSEILSQLPDHVHVCNATTDGFLSTANEREVKNATKGPICNIYRQACLRIVIDSELRGKPDILEKKHRIAQPLGWRTRGQATLEEVPGEKKIVLAKAGIKPPTKGVLEQNEWIIKGFVERTPDSSYKVDLLRSLREMCMKGGDLISKTFTRRLSMEFDWKRCPQNQSMRAIRGVDHLYFDTKPWATIDEHTRCRTAWERFNHKPRRVLKNLANLADFEAYHRQDSPEGIKRSRTEGSLKRARMMFLRAYVRSTWGLVEEQMDRAELAAWLTREGYDTSKADIENAKRMKAKLIEHCVARDPDVGRFIEIIKAQFPFFQEGMMLTQQDSKAA